MHYLLYLASFQVSAIAITGQGKVGAENGAPATNFQLAQRADFFESLIGEQTTYHRPIVNARDEALCGSEASGRPPFARLHCIFFDSTLCHVASLLKVGMMQIVLAMIEAERVDPRLLLEDPVDAVVRWSHDPELQTACPMVSGGHLTLLDLQRAFLEQAKRFADDGGCDGVVPRAADILALWGDTLDKLVAGDFAALALRLDWVLKRQTIERVLQQHPRLELDVARGQAHRSPLRQPRPVAGTLLGLRSKRPRRAGGERGEHRAARPASARGHARLGARGAAAARPPGHVFAVDWDSITFTGKGNGYRPRRRRIDLANPLAHTKSETRLLLRGAHDLGEVLDALGAEDVAAQGSSASMGPYNYQRGHA